MPFSQTGSTARRKAQPRRFGRAVGAIAIPGRTARPMSGVTQGTQSARPRNHELALTFGRAGLAVFPCLPNKRPVFKGSFHNAKVDADQINEMWFSCPNAPVGLPCGETNDLTVIDLDMCKKTGAATGEASIKAVMPELFGADGKPTVPAARTPSGGWHLYYQLTDNLKSRTGYLPSVDVRTTNGYVIAPFAELEAGKVYRPNALLKEYLDGLSKGTGSRLPEMPEALIAALLAGDPAPSDNPVQPDLSLSQQATPSARAYEQDDLPDLAQVQACLDHIDASIDRSDWMKVVSSLKNYGTEGRDIALSWSMTSTYPEHTEKKFHEEWKDLKPIAVRELFNVAKKCGADLSRIAIDNMPKPDEGELQRKGAHYAAQLDAYFSANVVPINADAAAAVADQFPKLAEPSEVSTADTRPDDLPQLPFKPWARVEAYQIPRVQFVYGSYLAKGYTSVTAAAPKVGKSLLALAEAVDIACGRGFLTGQKRGPQNVLYYCAEDDQDTINGRVIAILQLWGIDQTEIGGRLFAVSGIDVTGFALIAGQDGVIHEPLFTMLGAFCTKNQIACAIFDPLQDLSHSPETNEVFRLLGSRLRKFASDCDLAVGLIHHTRKGMAGVKSSIDDMRGGSALRGTARFNRLLVGMNEDEGAQAGVENHRSFMRIAESESNLAPPASEHVQWFEKTSITIANGASIGVVRPWSWPDAFTGITQQDAARVRHQVSALEPSPRFDPRAEDWVGALVAETLEIDLEKKAGKARVKALLSGWISTDVLRVETRADTRRKRDVKVVVAGDNNPLAGNVDA